MHLSLLWQHLKQSKVVSGLFCWDPNRGLIDSEIHRYCNSQWLLITTHKIQSLRFRVQIFPVSGVLVWPFRRDSNAALLISRGFVSIGGTHSHIPHAYKHLFCTWMDKNPHRMEKVNQSTGPNASPTTVNIDSSGNWIRPYINKTPANLNLLAYCI